MTSAWRESDRPCVLLCCGADWWPHTRILSTLHRAGIATHLIAPRGSMAAASRYPARHFHFTPEQGVVAALRGRLRARAYDWVYVGDEPTLEQLAPHAREAWAAEVFPLLPDHPEFDILFDKNVFLELSIRIGVSVAPGRTARDEGDALAIARAHGYPLAVKLRRGQGGGGVSRVDDAAQLRRVLEGIGGHYPVRVEAWLEGLVGATQALFSHGELLAWTSSIQLQNWPTPAGPSCARRVYDHPLIEPGLRAFGAATRYHGLCCPDWIAAPEGSLHFLELNPRAASMLEHDQFGDVDFARAFVAFAGGQPYRQPKASWGARGPTIYIFPQHLIYCVRSHDVGALRRWLPRASTHDLSYDDPGPVLRALGLVLCHGASEANAWLARRQSALRSSLSRALAAVSTPERVRLRDGASHDRPPEPRPA